MHIYYFCSVVLLSLCFILFIYFISIPFHSTSSTDTVLSLSYNSSSRLFTLLSSTYHHLFTVIFYLFSILSFFLSFFLFSVFLFFCQDKKDHTHSIGCSTALHPTSEFIKGHIDRYVDWSPYKGMIPVNSEIIVITLCSLIILFLLSVFTCLRWQYIKSILQPWNCFHKKGYTGISDSPEHNIENSSIQMS